MNEDFLHYIWKFQRFTSSQLRCEDGQSLEVIQTGQHNTNAGPDFLNARVRIGDTQWVGNVEIHISSSDWFRHKHHEDPAYDNVILHVVYANDKPVLDSNQNPIPVLILRDRFDYQIYRYYKSWVKKASFIACEELVQSVPDIVKTSAVHSEAVYRLETKAEYCLDLLHETRGDIEYTFYRLLCRSMGLSVNALPFEQLARCTPFSLIRKHSSDLFQLEALLLGQSGLLSSETHDDSYIAKLKSEYAYLQTKLNLTPMPGSAWKYARLRPQNFPAVRIAQLARIYHNKIGLAHEIMEGSTLQSLQAWFGISLDTPFWKTHYTLKSPSESRIKSVGEDTVNLLIINAVVPFLFSLASWNKDDQYKSLALRFLEEIPAEKNAVLTKFSKLGFRSESALDSQGLIGLKKNRCNPLKCLNCKIGTHILKNNGKIN